MTKVEDLFANITNDPLTSAFAPEEKKNLPSVGKGKPSPMSMVQSTASWDGGTFESFGKTAFMAKPESPLALYIHIPFCHHQCTFCPFFINKTYESFSADYRELLIKEILDTAHVLGDEIDRRQVKAVYFGGGTPSDMECDDLSQIIRLLHNTFSIATDAEITVEGRVKDFTADKAKAWVDAGANRFSLGIQTTDTQLRRKLSRQSDKTQIAKTLNDLCKSGAITVTDLIYGLPGQSKEMLLEDIRFLAQETDIDGLDLYELKLFPDSQLEKAIQRGTLPETPPLSEQARMFAAAYHSLQDFGFEHFYARHWRRNSKERSIYNALAKKQTDMIPFGSGAGGRLNGISLGNNGSYEGYIEQVKSGVKPLTRIMRTPLLDEQSFTHQLGLKLEKLRLPAIEKWPEHLRKDAAILMTQWQTAGIVAPQADAHGFLLTCAGAFWITRITKMLLGFVKSNT